MRTTLVVSVLLTLACQPQRDRAQDTALGDTSTLARIDSAPGSAAVRPGGAATATVFEISLWPGEGIPVIEAATTALRLRSAPSTSAPVSHTLATRVGARLTYDSTRYQTVQAGTIHVRAPAKIVGRDFGAVTSLSREEYHSGSPTSVTLDVTPPTAIELLQYRAEGTCFVRVDRRVIDATVCPTLDTAAFRVERQPVTRWWIHVVGPEQARGWLLLNDSTARVVRRSF